MAVHFLYTRAVGSCLTEMQQLQRMTFKRMSGAAFIVDITGTNRFDYPAGSAPVHGGGGSKRGEGARAPPTESVVSPW